MRSATYRHYKISAFSSDDTQTVTASCPRSPRQFVAISSGASVVAPSGAPADVPVALKADRPEGYYSWVAKTSEIAPHEGEWAMKVHVVCVPQFQGFYSPANGEDGTTMQPETDGSTQER